MTSRVVEGVSGVGGSVEEVKMDVKKKGPRYLLLASFGRILAAM